LGGAGVGRLRLGRDGALRALGSGGEGRLGFGSSVSRRLGINGEWCMCQR